MTDMRYFAVLLIATLYYNTNPHLQICCDMLLALYDTERDNKKKKYKKIYVKNHKKLEKIPFIFRR